MKKDQELELNLNRITLWEHLVRKDTFNEFKDFVVMLLQSKDMYFFEDEILETHNSNDIEQVLQQYPFILRTGARRKNEDGSFSHKFLNIGIEYFVQPKDFVYDYFFSYKLRQTNLLEMDNFLEYHLLNYYDNNLQEFSRFLRICTRKHETKLLRPEIIQTLHEWIEIKEKKQQQALQGIETEQSKSKKGKVKRQAEDKLTCLSQEQTVLLMSFLQQERVFLKDEYLNKKDAGIAFEILAGYSQHTIRQNLSNAKDYQNKENLKEIDNFLTRLKIAIGNTLKEK